MYEELFVNGVLEVTWLKTCFKCGIEKDQSEFYKHSAMQDKRLGKCKECTKRDVKTHRLKHVERVRAYDRARGGRQTPEYLKEYRSKFPRKYKATCMVNNAIRDKRLFREGCCVCAATERIHAHHADYAKPLNVRWLCVVHHFEWHRKNGEGANP